MNADDFGIVKAVSGAAALRDLGNYAPQPPLTATISATVRPARPPARSASRWPGGSAHAPTERRKLLADTDTVATEIDKLESGFHSTNRKLADLQNAAIEYVKMVEQ